MIRGQGGKGGIFSYWRWLDTPKVELGVSWLAPTELIRAACGISLEDKGA
jgi:hypothetical protein